MTFLTELRNELIQEAAVTRLFLARAPFDKTTFKPHDKSEELGRLAIHVAELLMWWKSVLEGDELNFIDFEPEKITNTNDLLNYFDSLLVDVLELLSSFKESELDDIWYMKHGEELLFSLNKKEVLRKFCMNHLIHHRAQLGMYLKILGIDVPATYGPSADDFDVLLTEKYSD